MEKTHRTHGLDSRQSALNKTSDLARPTHTSQKAWTDLEDIYKTPNKSNKLIFKPVRSDLNPIQT